MLKNLTPKLARTSRGIALSLLMGSACMTAQAQSASSPKFEVFGVVIVWAGGNPATGNTTPMISDFVVNSSWGSTSADDYDLIASNAHTVQTGTLVPLQDSMGSAQGTPLQLRRLSGEPNFQTDTNNDGVMDAQDSFSSFRVRAASEVRSRQMELNSSFYVASNVPFAIEGVAAPTGSTTLNDLRDIRATLSVTQSGNDGIAFGSASQLPHSGGPTAGTYLTNRRLYAMRNPRTIFTGDQKTANGFGSITEQSVRFDLNYRYNSGNANLSDGVFDIEAEVTYTVYVP